MKSIEESPFGNRLREAFSGATNTQIAGKLNTSKSNLTEYMKGRIPPGETLLKISEITKCDLHWLLTGEGRKEKRGLKLVTSEEQYIPVYLEQHIEEKVRILAQEEQETIEDEAAKLIIEALIARKVITDQIEGLQLQFFGEYQIKLVPILLLGTIAAGRPLYIFDSAETALVAEEFVLPGRNTYALRVHGDSMVDQGILDGDLIIVMETAEAHPGQTVVALIDGDKATVKRFYRRGKQVLLRPANPAHEDIILPPERVRIQGVVIGIQRRT